MRKINKCILTGYVLDVPIEIEEIDDEIIAYNHIATGDVKITYSAFKEIEQKGEVNTIIAGVCRNAFENKEIVPIINLSILENLNWFNYPESFEDKLNHLLMYIYTNGGGDFRAFTFLSSRDYPLAYAKDGNEFRFIMDKLQNRGYIEFQHRIVTSNNRTQYNNVRLTDYGIEIIKSKSNS